MSKVIIYSLLPRLWGSSNPDPVPNGSLEQNGCGHLEDIDQEALEYIRNMGASHVWYIGLLEHATTTDFAGIPADPAGIVKGRAGSPYAVKDYYDIAPSLVVDPSKRQEAFDALVERTHRAGLKFIMDFIPNHVARTYRSDSAPSGVLDLGAGDDPTIPFSTQNHFYYLPDTNLSLPNGEGYQETPARATGNDCFTPCPSVNDWYETVKLNYGVDYLNGGTEHFTPIPATWHSMLDILRYWAGRGVDGFRCDMAEMVPPAFWSWAIASLRTEGYELMFLAEIYQPERYDAYLSAGFDYLYDKVGMYDTLRAIIRGEVSASYFDAQRLSAEHRHGAMCYFLENHDEHRLASSYFAGSAEVSIPALATLLLSGGNPYLHYFGGELGEVGMDAEGFSGRDGRTSIFDYWTLSTIRRLRAGYEDGAELSAHERYLLEQHRALMTLAQRLNVVESGGYWGLNYAQGQGYNPHRTLSYLRYTQSEVLLVVANFSAQPCEQEVYIPSEFFHASGFPANVPLRLENHSEPSVRISTLTPYAPLTVQLPAWGVQVWHYSTLPV